MPEVSPQHLIFLEAFHGKAVSSRPLQAPHPSPIPGKNISTMLCNPSNPANPSHHHLHATLILPASRISWQRSSKRTNFYLVCFTTLIPKCPTDYDQEHLLSFICLLSLVFPSPLVAYVFIFTSTQSDGATSQLPAAFPSSLPPGHSSSRCC